jgi:tRNA threonylcarbamoyladenosine modification (KEOPS) complex Cgi121 subunit
MNHFALLYPSHYTLDKIVMKFQSRKNTNLKSNTKVQNVAKDMKFEILNKQASL